MYPFYGRLNAIFSFCKALESKVIRAYFATKISDIFSYFLHYIDLYKVLIDDFGFTLL